MDCVNIASVIIWANVDLSLIEPLRMNFGETWIEIKKGFIHENAFENVISYMGSIVCRRKWVNSQSDMKSHEISPTDVENVENKFKIVNNAAVSVKNYDVIKSKHFPRYWPFVRGIHRSRPTTSLNPFFTNGLHR